MSEIGRIEHHIVAALHRHGNVEVSWKKRPIDLRVNIEAVEEPLAYPVTVVIRDVDDDIVPPEIIQARYLIACDGAHSWTRKPLNIPLVGYLTDSTWGEWPLESPYDCHKYGLPLRRNQE